MLLILSPSSVYESLSLGRNVLSGATRSASLLQPVGHGDTASDMPVSARRGFKVGLGSPVEMVSGYIFRSCSPRAFFMVLLVHPEGGVWVFQVPWIPHCSSP